MFLVVALPLMTLLLRWMLRPLDRIERQARDVAERRFPRIERQALLRSRVSIGHGVGLSMVAEFVETPGERDAVRALGFDAAQGYRVGRPEPLV